MRWFGHRQDLRKDMRVVNRVAAYIWKKVHMFSGMISLKSYLISVNSGSEIRYDFSGMISVHIPAIICWDMHCIHYISMQN